jgi:hypothetical protein
MKTSIQHDLVLIKSYDQTNRVLIRARHGVIITEKISYRFYG